MAVCIIPNFAKMFNEIRTYKYRLICRAHRGFSWAAGPPSSAISMAVCIIQNFPYMFNENLTFLQNFFSKSLKPKGVIFSLPNLKF